MANFPTTVNPSYGLTQTSKPNIRIAQFGSGYSQRSTFGINQNLKTYSNVEFNTLLLCMILKFAKRDPLLRLSQIKRDYPLNFFFFFATLHVVNSNF